MIVSEARTSLTPVAYYRLRYSQGLVMFPLGVFLWKEEHHIMYNKRIWQWAATYFAGNKVEIDHVTESGKSKKIVFTQTTYAVAVFLANEFADWETGEEVWASQGNVAEALGLSRPAVNDAFTILQALDMMKMIKSQEERGGKSNLYNLTMPGTLSQEVLTELTPGVKLGYTTCKVSLHHVLSEFTQTTKRTTKLTTKRKTKEIKEIIEVKEKDNNPGKAGAPKINLNNDDILLDPQRVKSEGVRNEVTNTKKEIYILDSNTDVKEETRNQRCKESLHVNPMKASGQPTFQEVMERRAEMLKNKPKVEKVVEESSFTW